jgi:hypothetical protein
MRIFSGQQGIPGRQDTPVRDATGTERASTSRNVNVPQRTHVAAALSPHQAAEAPSDLHRKSVTALNRLFVSLGLPADRLSATIVSFAKFFSLPLEPSLLAKIRRQVLTPEHMPEQAKTQAPAAEMGRTPYMGTAVSREALSLAAASAAGKGVELTRQGLKRYAAAFEAEAEGGPAPEAGDSPDSEGQSLPEKWSIVPGAEFKEKLLAAAERDPLLALLNRLPGKNGQRWIVLPLNFADKESEYRLSFRVLLDNPDLLCKSGTVSGGIRMALEIVKLPGQGAGIQRRWLFMADSGGESGGIRGLTMYVQPSIAEKHFRLMVRQLAQALEIAPEKIYVKKGGDFSSFSMEMHHEDLSSVNEEV